MPVARTSFSVGGGRLVRAGAIVDPADPIVQGREHLFEPVEQATAAPGEVRGKVRSHECDVCGKTAASKAGLAAHKRSHDTDGG